MKSAQRERAIELRITHKMGYSAIAKEVRVAKSTLSRWLEDLPLSDARILELRRAAWSRGEAKRERFRQTMRLKRDERDHDIYSLQKRKFTRISKQAVFIAGLMLYAAEGDKKSRYEIAFSNTDATLVAFFAKWLDNFLGIPRRNLKIQLHLYENMDIRKEESYWIKQLGMNRTQLCKTQVKSLRAGSFSYRDLVRHGTCKLYVGGGVKKAELMLSIKAFFDTHERRLRV